ncbi:hypothetical protein L5515_008403 [Caenorhabditis briggsae]|uniref:Uncharacterized protein n=1 Tax=Caenorhabditis briggsae TaxID=6238 RepID=A0AAE9F7C8_CAEBR|nr:hypothetical protein L5515_008403 [Caenorhabditis briggsae]
MNIVPIVEVTWRKKNKKNKMKGTAESKTGNSSNVDLPNGSWYNNDERNQKRSMTSIIKPCITTAIKIFKSSYNSSTVIHYVLSSRLPCVLYCLLPRR